MKKIIIPILLMLVSLLGFNGCDQAGGGSDTIPPTITVYTPASGDTVVYGDNTIIYDSYDDQGLSFFELYVNDAFKQNFAANNGVRPTIKWTVDSALVGKRVSYYVKAYDLGGNAVTSQKKENIYVTLTKTAPTAPYGLSVKKFSNTINIAWKDSAKFVTGYELYRCEVTPPTDAAFSLITTLPANANNVNDVVPNTGMIYYYKIRSVNSLGKASAFSSIINSLGSSGTTGLLPPSDLTATARGTREVYLTWTNNTTNENYFVIERRQPSVSVYSQAGIVGPGSSYYTDISNDMYAGGTFYYRVRVFTSTDSASSNEVSVKTFPFELEAPSNLEGRFIDTPAVTKKTVRLTWSDNSNQETQNIVERKPEGGTYSVVKILGSDFTLYDDTDILRGVKYFYRVRNSAQGYYSKYSNEISITIP